MSKEQFMQNQFSFWIEKILKELNGYEELKKEKLNEKGKELLVKKTSELESELLKSLNKNTVDKKEYGDIIFFNYFSYAFINKIIKLKKGEEDGIIDNLFISQIQKFSYVFWLLVNEQYEASIILFRSLYEGLVITLFLLKNSCCIEKFSLASFYKIFNIFDKTSLQFIHDELKNNPNPRFNDLYSKEGFDKYSHEELLSGYGWARDGIKSKKSTEAKIDFRDILEEVFQDENFKIMYRMASSFVHSNMAVSANNIIQNIIKNMILSYIRSFCMPVFNDIFLGYYLTENIECYVYKTILENVKNKFTS